MRKFLATMLWVMLGVVFPLAVSSAQLIKDNAPSAVNAAGVSTKTIVAPAYQTSNTTGATQSNGQFLTSDGVADLQIFSNNGVTGNTIELFTPSTGVALLTIQEFFGLNGVEIDSSGLFAPLGATTFFTLPSIKIGGASATKIGASFRATTTTDVAAVAATTCNADIPITVTGAATGAECIVGMPSTTPALLQGTCFVSATNVVQLRICNGTAVASADPANATYSVRVFNP